MNRSLMLLGAALIAFGASFGITQQTIGATWHSDLEQAIVLARESNRPMLAVFR